MTKEELVEFLKDNLEIKIKAEEQERYIDGIKKVYGYVIKVSLELDRQQINYNSALIFVK